MIVRDCVCFMHVIIIIYEYEYESVVLFYSLHRASLNDKPLPYVKKTILGGVLLTFQSRGEG